jgi:hypothetical protein
MHLKLIVCEIFYREVCRLVSESPHTCDAEFLPKGLHDLGTEKMVARLRERLGSVEKGTYDAIVFVYGLCNNGLVGLSSPHTKLVLPRAHDCITLLMGSRDKYTEYFNSHPGTYYRTTGWYERNDSSSAGEMGISESLGLDVEYEKLVEQYGEDNAKYVMDMMGDATANYDRVTYISMGLPCDEQFRQQARVEAEEKGWTFDDYPGSMNLLRRAVNGEWAGGDFLVLEPGQSIQASHDDDVVKAG